MPPFPGNSCACLASTRGNRRRIPGREGLPAAANDASTCLVVACVSAATLEQRQLRSAVGGKRLLHAVAPRYITAMKLEIELSPAQEEKLRQEAQRLNIKPEELARAA